MGSTQQMRKQPRPPEADIMDDDALYETRSRSSVRRYRASQPVQPVQAVPPTRSTPLEQPAVPEVAERDTLGDPVLQQTMIIQRRRSSMNAKPQQSNGVASNAVSPALKAKARVTEQAKRSPVVFVLVGVVITILLFMTLASLSSWWHTYQDDLHYGRPRTSQLDAVVGHNDSAANPTHFIFLNLHRHVEIIEIPGGDAAHTRIYTGPTLFGNGQDLTPVTGEVRDVNHDGKPDLIIHIQDQQIIYLNDGTTFHSQ